MAEAPAIRLRGLTKSFGTVTAVDALDLDIMPGEFFSMLGPSGSGKTTVLRLIAGFEQPTAGSIELFGDDVTKRAPFDRDVNTVFQDYALFPHMNVIDNVAYGLRVRGVGRAERRKRALEALASVRLESFADRKPSQLSGGQRQRVALARATVVEPKALLLDEPLGALDLKLRQGMQVELKEMQRDLGITFIFVTHDQEEALTLSDRIAVFNEGRIEQLGTPQQIYESPVSPFVADFVGTSNLFTAAEARRMLKVDGERSLRPEKITLSPPGATTPKGAVSVKGTVSEVIYLGTSTRILVDVDDGYRLNVLEQNVSTRGSDVRDRRGTAVVASWSPADVVSLHP
ncbi:MAG TPA: ABC transporter ATP-binding protein [Pseudolysinimonas sp.]|nr:ABC transporter ATP-binding protein [Pseudolysinimonas sp.]